MPELWQQQALALGGVDLVAKIDQMARDIHTIADNQKAAFPDGDIAGHRIYHQSIIERNRELRKIRIALQEKCIVTLLWLGAVWLFKLVLETLRQRYGA